MSATVVFLLRLDMVVLATCMTSLRLLSGLQVRERRSAAKSSLVFFLLSMARAEVIEKENPKIEVKETIRVPWIRTNK